MKRVLFLMIVLALLMAGCRTKYLAVPEYRYRDSVQVRHERDSVYVSEMVAGDTVYLTRYRERTLYRDRLHTDTLRIVRTDSISVPYPVEKRVDVTPSWAWYVLLYAAIMTAIIVLFIKKSKRFEQQERRVHFHVQSSFLPFAAYSRIHLHIKSERDPLTVCKMSCTSCVA